jgi:hypothetical protein
MKLSTSTLDVLKNFAAINPNLVVKSGEPLSTISEAKNIMASAEIPESFTSDFGIYDLNEFISMFNLMTDPDLTFGDSSVQFTSGRSRASYRFADPSVLTAPKNKINMPSADLAVTITGDILTQIRKAAGVLGHSIVSIQGKNGTVTLSVVDPKNSASNTFSVVIDESNDQTGSFDLQFLISNLKVILGDYEVKISSKLISHWKHVSADVNYHIALEKSSTFNS